MSRAGAAKAGLARPDPARPGLVQAGSAGLARVCSGHAQATRPESGPGPTKPDQAWPRLARPGPDQSLCPIHSTIIKSFAILHVLGQEICQITHGFQKGFPWNCKWCLSRLVGFMLSGCSEETKDPINTNMTNMPLARALCTYVAQDAALDF